MGLIVDRRPWPFHSFHILQHYNTLFPINQSIMGGDGGVIASNRRYMRGAGTADHTADPNTVKQKKHQAYNNPQEVLTTCALTGKKFQSDSIIVACRFGRLYLREAAIQELLERKSSRRSSEEDTTSSPPSQSPLAHVRKLSEFHVVRFQYQQQDSSSSSTNNNNNSSNNNNATCPITGKVLNGSIPAILLVPGRDDQPNVISESSWKQLKETQWQEEYGPISKRIRLAPPLVLLEELQAAYEQEVVEHNNNKQKKKKRRKDKEETTTTTTTKQKGNSSTQHNNKKVKRSESATTITTTTTTTKARVESAIQSNKVLSSLFTTTSSKTKKFSEKEHKDNLFARC
jgi:hypothetical protein